MRNATQIGMSNMTLVNAILFIFLGLFMIFWALYMAQISIWLCWVAAILFFIISIGEWVLYFKHRRKNAHRN